MFKKLIKFLFADARIQVNKITGEIRVETAAGVFPRMWCTQATFKHMSEAENWLEKRKERIKVNNSWKTIHRDC